MVSSCCSYFSPNLILLLYVFIADSYPRNGPAPRVDVRSYKAYSKLVISSQHCAPTKSLNLPGECWAEMQQLALIGLSSSLHSEACNALGASDGVIHSRISCEAVSL